MECSSTTSFWAKSYGVLLQNKLLGQKLWSVAPNQVKVIKMETKWRQNGDNMGTKMKQNGDKMEAKME